MGRIEALEQRGDLAARVEALEAALRKTNGEIAGLKLWRAQVVKSGAA